MDAKTLKKLAAACRRAGISHYRCADFEFTLGDLPQRTKVSKASKPLSKSEIEPNGTINSDQELTEQQLLFWSTDTSSEDEEIRTQ